MVFVFGTRAWVPGCLGGRSREAWAAFPGLLERLPKGSLGGVPDPMSAGQNLPSPLGFGIVFYVDFDIDF